MKIGILGAGGRMGQMLTRELLSGQYGAELAAAIEMQGNPLLGKDVVHGCGVKYTADKEAAFHICEALIDFTSAASCIDSAVLAARYKKPLVVGTTGLNGTEETALKEAAKSVAIFYTANMSVGVNLLMSLVEQAAAKLNAEYDIEIFEAHHRHKTDAPSGTALALGHAAAKGRGVQLGDAMVPTRFGNTGARVPGTIGMSVFRGGDVIGDHTVTFAGMGERIELTHKASDRAIFAKGAIKAALWLKGRAPGIYSMRDLLGL